MRSLIMLAIALLCACDSDPDRRPIGGTCDEPTQCQSGLCVQNLCIDPAGCATVFASGDDSSLVFACLDGLESITVTPGDATVALGGQVQFTAVGRFVAREGSAPALTSSEADLTAVVTWRSEPDGLFISETPGLATISTTASLSYIVRATLEQGDLSVSGTAGLMVTMRGR